MILKDKNTINDPGGKVLKTYKWLVRDSQGIEYLTDSIYRETKLNYIRLDKALRTKSQNYYDNLEELEKDSHETTINGNYTLIKFT